MRTGGASGRRSTVSLTVTLGEGGKSMKVKVPATV